MVCGIIILGRSLYQKKPIYSLSSKALNTSPGPGNLSTAVLQELILLSRLVRSNELQCILCLDL